MFETNRSRELALLSMSFCVAAKPVIHDMLSQQSQFARIFWKLDKISRICYFLSYFRIQVRTYHKPKYFSSIFTKGENLHYVYADFYLNLSYSTHCPDRL